MTPLSFIEIKLCQAQAKIFEASVTKTNYSSPIFIRRFVYSSIAKSFDDKVYLYRSDTIEDAIDIINEEFGESRYGQKKYSIDQMFWIGYIYRCICIKYNLSSKSVYKLFKGDIYGRIFAEACKKSISCGAVFIPDVYNDKQIFLNIHGNYITLIFNIKRINYAHFCKAVIVIHLHPKT